MLQKYERKAEDILEKLAQEEPNERNFKMMAEALIILGGGKVMEAMGGGQMSRYDGMRYEDEYQRGRGGRGRGRGRGRDSMGRFRYDGGMDGDMGGWEEDEEEMYYNGSGGSGGRSGGGGGRSGGGMGGRSGGGR